MHDKHLETTTTASEIGSRMKQIEQDARFVFNLDEVDGGLDPATLRDNTFSALAKHIGVEQPCTG
jgi:hypothetical protein